MRKEEKALSELVGKAMNRCFSAGCNDQETDRLLEGLLTVHSTLGLEAAEAVARHITDINPGYTFSSNPAILTRQIQDWL